MNGTNKTALALSVLLLTCCGGAVAYKAATDDGYAPAPAPGSTVEATVPVEPIFDPPQITLSTPAPAVTTPALKRTTAKPKPKLKPKPRRTTEQPYEPEVYYANCTEVRAAGAAPIYRGQPGYSGDLDRDGDGVACE